MLLKFDRNRTVNAKVIVVLVQSVVSSQHVQTCLLKTVSSQQSAGQISSQQSADFTPVPKHDDFTFIYQTLGCSKAVGDRP